MENMDENMSSNIQLCKDTSDCTELSAYAGLYLKPIARLNITVTLPQLKSGQTISNWEIMEKLRAAIQPEKFTTIKVTESTGALKFLRFDAEIDNKKKLGYVISRIDKKGIKLSGLVDLLKIHAVEAKIPFPSRHDWDSFFRDAKHMNEMKPGERPDTVHLQDLPCAWFCQDNSGKPSEYALRKIFQTFGDIRAVDIPCLDPFRKQMSSSISGSNTGTFSFKDNVLFDAYVQFKEYIGFAKCMHELQGKKLIWKRDKTWSSSIKVDFDKSKHLSEYTIKKRAVERDKLMMSERERLDKLHKVQHLESLKAESERMAQEESLQKKKEEKMLKKKEREQRRKQREMKRRMKKMQSKDDPEKEEKTIASIEERMSRKIALEERKLLIAQRKLESIRLLDTLFDRIKVNHRKEVMTLRAMEGGKLNLLDVQNKISNAEWFNDECKSVDRLRKYYKGRFLKAPKDLNAKAMYVNAKKKCKATIKKARKDFLEQQQKEEDENDMVAKEKKLRERLINSLKRQQQEAMFHQQKRVEKVIQGKILDKSGGGTHRTKAPVDEDSDSSLTSDSFDSLSLDDERERDGNQFPSGPMGMDQMNMMNNGPPPGFFPHGGPMDWNQMPPPNFDQPFNPNFFPGGPDMQFMNHMGRGNMGMNRGFRGGPYPFFPMRGGPWDQMRGRGFMNRGRWINRGKNKIQRGKPQNPDQPQKLVETKWFRRDKAYQERRKYRPEEDEEQQQQQQQQQQQMQGRQRMRMRSWSASRSRTRSKSRGSRRWSSRSRSRSRKRSRSRSDSRSRSRSDSRKSRSRSGSKRKSRSRSGSKRKSRSLSGSKKKSRSQSGSKRKSRSQSGSKRKSRSRSLSRKKSRSRSGSAKSASQTAGKEGRDKKSRSKSKEKSKSRSRSKAKSGSRSSSRSRSHSRHRSRSSSRSRSRSSRHKSSKSRSRGRSRSSRKRSRSYSRSRSRSKHRRSYKRRSRKDYDSEIEMSSEEKWGDYDHFGEDFFPNQNFFPYHHDMRMRGRGFRFFHNRGRKNFRFRGNWRPFKQYHHQQQHHQQRGFGFQPPNYYNPHYADMPHEEPSPEDERNAEMVEEYHDLYRKYFTSIAEKEESKRKQQMKNIEKSDDENDKESNEKEKKMVAKEKARKKDIPSEKKMKEEPLEGEGKKKKFSRSYSSYRSKENENSEEESSDVSPKKDKPKVEKKKSVDQEYQSKEQQARYEIMSLLSRRNVPENESDTEGRRRRDSFKGRQEGPFPRRDFDHEEDRELDDGKLYSDKQSEMNLRERLGSNRRPYVVRGFRMRNRGGFDDRRDFRFRGRGFYVHHDRYDDIDRRQYQERGSPPDMRRSHSSQDGGKKEDSSPDEKFKAVSPTRRLGGSPTDMRGRKRTVSSDKEQNFAKAKFGSRSRNESLSHSDKEFSDEDRQYGPKRNYDKERELEDKRRQQMFALENRYREEEERIRAKAERREPREIPLEFKGRKNIRQRQLDSDEELNEKTAKKMNLQRKGAPVSPPPGKALFSEEKTMKKKKSDNMEEKIKMKLKKKKKKEMKTP